MFRVLPIVLSSLSLLFSNFASASSCQCNGLASNFPGSGLVCDGKVIRYFQWGQGSVTEIEKARDACLAAAGGASSKNPSFAAVK